MLIEKTKTQVRHERNVNDVAAVRIGEDILIEGEVAGLDVVPFSRCKRRVNFY